MRHRHWVRLVGRLALAAAVLVPAGCGSENGSDVPGTVATSTRDAAPSTTAEPTTSQPPATIAVADLQAVAQRAVLPANALLDLGVAASESEHAERFVLASSCPVDLLAEQGEYANYYRDWALDGGGTVKSLGFAFHESTGAEVVNELGAALAGCDRWAEPETGEEFVVVRNAPIVRPEGLGDFYAYCADMPGQPAHVSCTAFLGQGNLVARVSTFTPGGGPQSLEVLNQLLPRAAQALLAASGG